MPHPHYPAWVLDAVPGADDALAKIAEAEEALEPLRGAVGAAIAARGRKVRMRNGVLEPVPGVSTAEVEDLTERIRTAESAERLAARRLTRARDALDALVQDARRSGVLKTAAAKAALDRHAEAAEAWAVVDRALAERDEAYKLAGSPGLSWENRHYATPVEARSAEGHARSVVARRVNGFDTYAVTAVASGDDLESIELPAGQSIRPVARNR